MPLRMLIVDDERDVSEFLGEIASGAGYEVVTANCAKDFKAAFAADRADVILLDLTLPDTDGIELLKYMAERGTRARILIVSGYDETIRHMAYEIGAARGLDMAGVLAKPVNMPDFEGLLDQFKRDAGQPN